MIFKITGSALKKDTKTKVWWLKLAVAIIFSNIFFFTIFSGNETEKVISAIPQGWVEIQVRAELLTPFHSGKKVLLIQRSARKQVEAMLETSPQDPEGRFTILVKETEAQTLLTYDHWEIVPFLKTLSFAPVKRGEAHEIRY